MITGNIERSLGREEAESFLYREALLIDDRRFEEWLELFTPDGIYWVPSNRDDIDPTREVSIIYDDARRRAWRVERLQSRHNWSQDPPARVRHFVTNVLVEPLEDDRFLIRSNQLISHVRLEHTNTLPAHCEHLLARIDGSLRILLKKVCLLQSNQYLIPDAITLL